MAAKIQKPANRAAAKGMGRAGQGICIWSIQQSGNCSALDKLRCIDHFADSARLKILGVHLRYTKLAEGRGEAGSRGRAVQLRGRGRPTKC